MPWVKFQKPFEWDFRNEHGTLRQTTVWRAGQVDNVKRVIAEAAIASGAAVAHTREGRDGDAEGQ